MNSLPAIRISVVIPAKNEERYIGSTLAQYEPYLERFGLEVIVSDGGSTDATVAVVREIQTHWPPGRLKLAQPRGKQNIAIGRNAGAALAEGEFLFHTDADVQIPDLPNFFETLLQTFEKHPDIVAATVPIHVYPQEARWIDRLYHTIMNWAIYASFYIGVYLAKGESQFVRRSIFERIGGYNERIVAGEDCNLFYRLHWQGRIAFLRRLRVYHSPRRFRKYGYLRLNLIYLREALSLLFLRRSYVEEWKVVR
ncbi:MAG: glycosyltransferase [Saprospiraceae bacterium]|nr:glycosyltransferase [Saprospiraceae bacterium]MDW8483570.1 glycosyltransferase [Saprospiraceae bacterium]